MLNAFEYILYIANLVNQFLLCLKLYILDSSHYSYLKEIFLNDYVYDARLTGDSIERQYQQKVMYVSASKTTHMH